MNDIAPRYTHIVKSATWRMTPFPNPVTIKGEFATEEDAIDSARAIFEAVREEVAEFGINGKEQLLSYEEEENPGGWLDRRLVLVSDAAFGVVHDLLHNAGLLVLFPELSEVIKLNDVQREAVEMGGFTGQDPRDKPFGFFKSEEDAKKAAAALFEAVNDHLQVNLANAKIRGHLSQDAKLDSVNDIFEIEEMDGVFVLSIKETDVISSDIDDGTGKIRAAQLMSTALHGTRAACRYPHDLEGDLNDRIDSRLPNAFPSSLVAQVIKLSRLALDGSIVRGSRS